MIILCNKISLHPCFSEHSIGQSEQFPHSSGVEAVEILGVPEVVTSNRESVLEKSGMFFFFA